MQLTTITQRLGAALAASAMTALMVFGIGAVADEYHREQLSASACAGAPANARCAPAPAHTRLRLAGQCIPRG